MKSADQPDRAARLAARLRENLHRRKAQSRSREATAEDASAGDGPALPKSPDGG